MIPVQGELVSDIPAGDGKTANFFLQCTDKEMEMGREREIGMGGRETEVGGGRQRWVEGDGDGWRETEMGGGRQRWVEGDGDGWRET